jgi:hypothetical protein
MPVGWERGESWLSSACWGCSTGRRRRKALAALRARPEIPGLTEPLVALSEEEWQWAVSSLREHGFLLPADPQQPGALDAHPLVRV